MRLDGRQNVIERDLLVERLMHRQRPGGADDAGIDVNGDRADGAGPAAAPAPAAPAARAAARSRQRIGQQADDSPFRRAVRLELQFLSARRGKMRLAQHLLRRDGVVEFDLQDVTFVLIEAALPQLNDPRRFRRYLADERPGHGNPLRRAQVLAQKNAGKARGPGQVARGRERDRARIVPVPLPSQRWGDRSGRWRGGGAGDIERNIEVEAPAQRGTSVDDRAIAGEELLDAQESAEAARAGDAVVNDPCADVEKKENENGLPEASASCRRVRPGEGGCGHGRHP